MKNYNIIAKSIVFNVGGKKNIKSLSHCVTRLRFILKDESKVDVENLKQIDKVITVVQHGGTTQVVIGTDVGDVYDAVCDVANIKTTSEEDSTEEKEENGMGFTQPESKKNVLGKFIDLVSGIFIPILPALIASGVTKGLLVMLKTFGIMNATSGTYKIIYFAADSIFYFLPILVAASAAKKFRLDQILAMGIASSLLYPSLIAFTKGQVLYTLFENTIFSSDVYVTFLGLPVILMNYKQSVIPAIFAVYFASRIFKFMNKHLHPNLKRIFAPVFTLIITVPVSLIIIGPAATYLSDFLSYVLNIIYYACPPLAGLAMGFLWQVLVMMGLHWGFVPLFINEIATSGFSGFNALVTATPLATTGVVLAIYLKTKNKELKQLAAPAMVSSLCGISEPAIYGITLPRKKPFVITLIGASVGGFIIGLAKSKIFLVGGNGIFKLLSTINPEKGIDSTWYGYLIALIAAFFIGFTLTWFFGFSDKEDAKNGRGPKKTAAKKNTTVEEEVPAVKKDIPTDGVKIASPFKGNVVLLKDFPDEVFSKGCMGEGIAIEPTEGKLYAPCDGLLEVVSSTKHAFYIKSDEGLEILVHIGIDTVKLNGEGFTVLKKQDERIKKGDLIATFDLDFIKSKGYCVTSPVVISSDDEISVDSTQDKTVDYQGNLLVAKVQA